MDDAKLAQLAEIKISYVDIVLQWKRGKNLKDFLDSHADLLSTHLKDEYFAYPHSLEDQVPKGKRKFYDKKHDVLEKAWDKAVHPTGSPDDAINYAREWIGELTSMYVESRKKIELLFKKMRELVKEGDSLGIQICEYEEKIREQGKKANKKLNKSLLESYVENKIYQAHVYQRIKCLNTTLEIKYAHYAELQSVIDRQIIKLSENRSF